MSLPRLALPCLLLGLVLPQAASADEPAAVSAEEAAAFLEETEARLLELMIRRERAWWVQYNFITHDTEIIAAQAVADMMAFVSEAAAESRRFSELDLSYEQRRKLDLLRLALDLPAPQDPALRDELATIAAELESAYGKGKYCPAEGDCKNLGELADVISQSRDWDELLEAWQGWRTIAPPMREPYARFVELANLGAQDLGYDDLGHLWKSRYDMESVAFEQEVDRLWSQVEPLYSDLHCYVRQQLQEEYGKKRVPKRKPIPAHLLGNMWGQEWQTLYDQLAPEPDVAVDLDAAIVKTGWDEKELVAKAESFFVSLGLDPLPKTFYERSLFVKPRDRDVACHASAWDVDFDEDLRVKMCIRRRYDDFATMHHELGHVYYYYTMRKHPTLFRDDANAAFNEAIGDTIQLSVTPEHLVRLGILEQVPDGELNALMERALGAVAFLPFGLIVDKWRWDVFAGRVAPEDYNAHWWDLKERYQGIAPPVDRPTDAFDPGAKNHIPTNTPYIRYFLSTILQYQFHRALCQQSGHEGPLHTCSIHGQEEAGQRLEDMMAMGATRPWPDALEKLSGERQMDATAIQEYYAPLQAWLQERNKGCRCGW